jgi:hypothetical protein
MQVAKVIRSIGPEFAAYGEEIERQQIVGGMLTSLSFEDLSSLLVCLHSHIMTKFNILLVVTMYAVVMRASGVDCASIES